MYLLDTDVLSITSPASRFQTDEVDRWRDWVRKNEHGLYFSVTTIMEVRFGVEQCVAKGATKKAELLRKWLAAVETIHHGRIIPITIEIAHKAGEMLYQAVGSGAQPSAEDAQIAATAAVKGYKLLSRNEKHMMAMKADFSNPLTVLPEDVPPRSFS